MGGAERSGDDAGREPSDGRTDGSSWMGSEVARSEGRKVAHPMGREDLGMPCNTV
jgi:hypothetical protein